MANFEVAGLITLQRDCRGRAGLRARLRRVQRKRMKKAGRVDSREWG